jgi:hypothetical protein
MKQSLNVLKLTFFFFRCENNGRVFTKQSHWLYLATNWPHEVDEEYFEIDISD